MHLARARTHTQTHRGKEKNRANKELTEHGTSGTKQAHLKNKTKHETQNTKTQKHKQNQRNRTHTHASAQK
jgi:hypothetical protein